MKKTIFCDIDGCIIKHNGNLTTQLLMEAELLPGAIDKINEWNYMGYTLILTTGRKESMRKKTEQDLENLGVFYDKLIMGLPRGERVVINDKKYGSEEDQASAINLTRNEGIGSIRI